MLKKLIVTGAAAGLLLISAAGAFANGGDEGGGGDGGSSAPTVNLDNYAHVYNNVDTSANSGWNAVTGGNVSGSYILTGAASAGLSLTNQINFTQLGCGCSLGDVTIDNDAWLKNWVETSANTGWNSLTATGGSSGEHHEDDNGGSAGGVSGSYITTGAAAGSSVLSNIVNTTVFGSL